MTTEPRSLKNRHDSREAWLRAAADAMAPEFEKVGHPVPKKIRFCHGFTSAGRRLDTKGRPIDGELWHPGASGDQSFELFISAHLDDPVAVLAALRHQLIHSALPADAGHGPQFRDLALQLGFKGPMRNAVPGTVLTERLHALAAQLGPLPHASLDFVKHTMQGGFVSDRPKKQTTRMHKAECQAFGCGYTVRVSAKWLEVGVPHCPRHGAMQADLPERDDDSPIIDGDFTVHDAGSGPEPAAANGRLQLTEGGSS